MAKKQILYATILHDSYWWLYQGRLLVSRVLDKLKWRWGNFPYPGPVERWRKFSTFVLRQYE